MARPEETPAAHRRPPGILDKELRRGAPPQLGSRPRRRDQERLQVPSYDDVDASRPSEPPSDFREGADFERPALEAFAVSLSQDRRNARTRSPSWCSTLPGSLSVNIGHAPIIWGNCGCA